MKHIRGMTRVAPIKKSPKDYLPERAVSRGRKADKKDGDGMGGRDDETIGLMCEGGTTRGTKIGGVQKVEV